MKPTVWAAPLLAVALLAMAACGPSPGADGRAFAQVFKDFVFLGSFPEVRGHGVPLHGYDPVEVPNVFVHDRLYVFQHIGPLDLDEFAVSELPRRMRAVGMEVLHAPKSKGEMPIGEPTGLTWWIDFQTRGYKGEIHPWLDPVLYQRGGLAPNGSVQALVVTITK